VAPALFVSEKQGSRVKGASGWRCAWLALKVGLDFDPGMGHIFSAVFDVQYVKCIDFASQMTF
jgi:hypothetical protein